MGTTISLVSDAFNSPKGGFDLKQLAGIAVSGTVHVRPRKEKAAASEDSGDDFLE